MQTQLVTFKPQLSSYKSGVHKQAYADNTNYKLNIYTQISIGNADHGMYILANFFY